MDDAKQLSDATRNEAFRRIGRNLYIFQLIEAALKHLIVYSSLEGHPHDLSSVMAKKAKKVRKKSMGDLVQSFSASVFKHDGAAFAGSEPVPSPRFAFSYQIEIDAASAHEWKRKLQSVTRERNKLVHQDLHGIAPDAAEQWCALSEALDQQREKLVGQFEL